eukprot:746032-Hanusia_phi.AAC.1
MMRLRMRMRMRKNVQGMRSSEGVQRLLKQSPELSFPIGKFFSSSCHVASLTRIGSSGPFRASEESQCPAVPAAAGPPAGRAYATLVHSAYRTPIIIKPGACLLVAPHAGPRPS